MENFIVKDWVKAIIFEQITKHKIIDRSYLQGVYVASDSVIAVVIVPDIYGTTSISYLTVIGEETKVLQNVFLL